MTSVRTVQLNQRRCNLHDFVIRQINTGRTAYDVLNDLNAASVGYLCTLHGIGANSVYGGPSSRKADRIVALCREVYTK